MNKRFLFFGFGLMGMLLACTHKLKPASGEPVPVVAAAPLVEGQVIQPTSVNDVDTIKKSLKAFADGSIGNANIKIMYHSPAVRGRVIWGGLVPYDQVWVTGAHMATAMQIDKPIKVGDKHLNAGKYALFTFPGKEEWVVVINRNWEQHLADEYNASDDIVRLTVKPEMGNAIQERLMYRINRENERTGNIEFHWEKLKLFIPIQVPSGN